MVQAKPIKGAVVYIRHNDGGERERQRVKKERESKRERERVGIIVDLTDDAPFVIS